MTTCYESPLETQRKAKRKLARAILSRRGVAVPDDRLLGASPSISLSLAAFVESTTQFKLEPWQQRVCGRLERLPEQTGQRVLVHGPPQFGKSIIISQRLPAWSIGRRPDLRFRLACYNETHAERFSRVNLAVLQDPEFARMFPGVAIPPVNASAKEWSTGQRKAMRDGQPSFVALGIGSGFVGMGADLLVIDDPYKSREEAFSDTINENVWLWWSDVVLPRLNPDTNVVVMFHRWRSNDLAGRLLEQGGWELLRFPAIADGLEGDCSELPEGEPLSQRFSVSFLRGVETQQGSLAFNALYQGNPGDATGNLIRAEWFRDYRIEGDCYALQRGERWERVRMADCWRFSTVDFASSDAKSADWTVCSTFAVTPRRDILALNVKRGREEGPEAKALVKGELRRWEPAFVVVEKNGLGLPMTQDLEREGWPIRGIFQHQKKEVRAQSLAAAYETGRMYHPLEADWLPAWRKELLAFPAGANDDQLDTGSLAARAVVAANAVIADFSPSLHVAMGAIPYDADLPLVGGWSFEPRPAFAVGQKDADNRLAVFFGMTAEVGEGPGAFACRVAERLREEFSEGALRHTDLAQQHFGPGEYLGSSKSKPDLRRALMTGCEVGVYGVEQGTPETPPDFLVAPSGTTREQRDEAIRARCRLVTQGLPSLLVDPEAMKLIDALAGGYAYKSDVKTGLPMPEPEPNEAAALCEALGFIAAHCASVKADEDEGGYVQPVTRAGRRRSRW